MTQKKKIPDNVDILTAR